MQAVNEDAGAEKQHERPPLDLANVLRQVAAIQEQLRREMEAREKKCP